jgi:hypothetical protein
LPADPARAGWHGMKRIFAYLLAEMRRARAVVESDGMLYPATPYMAPAPGWRNRPGAPRDWA